MFFLNLESPGYVLWSEISIYAALRVCADIVVAITLTQSRPHEPGCCCPFTSPTVPLASHCRGTLRGIIRPNQSSPLSGRDPPPPQKKTETVQHLMASRDDIQYIPHTRSTS